MQYVIEADLDEVYLSRLVDIRIRNVASKQDAERLEHGCNKLKAAYDRQCNKYGDEGCLVEMFPFEIQAM